MFEVSRGARPLSPEHWSADTMGTIDLIRGLRDFRREEEGAVTVDWVVLAAAVVLLAIPIATTVRAPVQSATTGIAEKVVDATD